MNTTGTMNTKPAGELAEIQIGWGDDTKCTGCFTDLPAGAPAWVDGDGTLCCMCAEAEGAITPGDAEWIARAVRMAAEETLTEYPS